MPFATGTVLLIVVSALFLIATDVVMGVVAVAVFPLLIGLNIVYQKRVDVYYETAQQHLGALSAGVHESFEGVQLVKAYGAEARETERLAEMAGHLRTARTGAVQLRGTFEALLDVLPSMTNVGLVVLGAWQVSRGELTVGQLSSFIYLFTLLVFPLRLIGYALSELPHSLAGWRRVREVLDEPVEPDPLEAIIPSPRPVAACSSTVSVSRTPANRDRRSPTCRSTSPAVASSPSSARRARARARWWRSPVASSPPTRGR